MRGLITLATGASHYYDMAAKLARSVKYHNPDEKICLLCDKADMAQGEAYRYFSHVIEMPSSVIARGVEFKLFVNELSPFSKTMFIDADMLQTKNNLEEIWDSLDGKAFGMQGEKITSGFWRVDISKLIELLQIPYVVRGNGGGFYFEKSDASDAFFDYCRRIFIDRRDDITVMHNKGFGYSIEPIFGAAQGHFNIEPVPLDVQWNVSTLKYKSWSIEPNCVSFTKENGKVFAPTFIHFIGLGKNHSPNDLYKRYLDGIG